MFDWWVRQQERRYEIDRGADADLLCDARRRPFIGLALITLALLLGLVYFKLHLAGTLKAIAIAIIAVLFDVVVDWRHGPERSATSYTNQTLRNLQAS